MTDNNGYVLAPLPVAPVNETDMVLLPKGLDALKQVAKEVGLDLRGVYVNLDGGFDSRANRKCIFNAGMIPNIKENPRNRKHPKRGRKRLFNAAIHALRMRVERTFAWEDKFKRLLLRFERIQQRHYGMKLLAYTLIKPTVSLGGTSAVVCTYGCGDGRIALTRCALIDGVLGDRCSQCPGYRTPPATAGSARSALVAKSRPVSIADPDGFPRARTTPRSWTRPCGDASPARCVPGTRPFPLHPCLV